MARKVLSGLIQCGNPINDESRPVAEIQAAMLEKHMPFIHDAGKKLYVWTVDDPKRIDSLTVLGVDGICSNDPRLLNQAT